MGWTLTPAPRARADWSKNSGLLSSRRLNIEQFGGVLKQHTHAPPPFYGVRSFRTFTCANCRKLGDNEKVLTTLRTSGSSRGLLLVGVSRFTTPLGSSRARADCMQKVALTRRKQDFADFAEAIKKGRPHARARARGLSKKFPPIGRRGFTKNLVKPRGRPSKEDFNFREGGGLLLKFALKALMLAFVSFRPGRPSCLQP